MSLYDEKVLNELFGLVAEGLDIESACYIAGLNPRKFLMELEKGKKAFEKDGRVLKSETEYLALWTSVTRARGLAIRLHVNKVREADDWKASKWWLETQVGGTYGKHVVFNELTTSPIEEIES